MGLMREAGDNLFVTIPSGKVSYNDNGPVYAPAVIFIHGTPFDKRIWDLQAELLTNNYRVIAYDLRGHGGSEMPGDTVTVSDLAGDLAALMDALDVDKAILCGLSTGCFVALEAVQRFPHRFHALVLSGAQCLTDHPAALAGRQALLEVLSKKGIEPFADEVVQRYFNPRAFVHRRDEVRMARRMIMEASPAAISKHSDALAARGEYCSGLGALRMPVLLIAGREDLVTPPATIGSMRDRIPGAELQYIEYAGHLPNLENTHEFNRLLLAFISRVCRDQQLSPHCEDAPVLQERRLKV